ncbi:hypothetical protein MMC28_011707 [Mycoblastus sanguinarius]|nr:hypothetical protein [Mycoblastus sanguinarius]
MTCSIHSASTEGFKNASSYEKHRPSYPPEAVESLLWHLQVNGVEGARILDLAAGTGKFTEILSRRGENYEIIAVEPHEGMRDELKKKMLRGVKVMEGEAKNMNGVDSQSIDAVIAAQSMQVPGPLKRSDIVQAFHWFAKDEALEEIYRVLSPGRVFGMIWNIEDYNAPRSWTPTTEWEAKMKDITWSFGNNVARLRHEKWKEVFEKQLKSTPFSIQAANPLFSLPLGEESVTFTHRLSREAIWERYQTLSQFAVLEGEELAVSRLARTFEF